MLLVECKKVRHGKDPFGTGQMTPKVALISTVDGVQLTECWLSLSYAGSLISTQTDGGPNTRAMEPS